MKAEKLEAILNKMLRDITVANTNWILWNGLREKMQVGAEYEKLLEYSPCFWTVTLNNLLSVALLGIAKLYDEQKDSLGLAKLISICEQNQKLFPESHTMKCVNGYTGEQESLVISKSIGTTIEVSRKKYQSVQKYRKQLITLRDKHLAHMDKKYFLIERDLYNEVALEREALEKLLETAAEIVNSLLSNLSHTVVYTEYENADDYKILLRYVKEGKEAYLQKIRAMFDHNT